MQGIQLPVFLASYVSSLRHQLLAEAFSLTGGIERRLEILDNAKTIHDLMALPSNRFETLTGDRVGQFSIRVNHQWRVCFEWRDADAYNVEIVDYH